MTGKKNWYSIERPDESKEYLHGWATTGKYLQTLFNQYNADIDNEYTGFCWIRTQITSPSFDSMNFRFKNRIFSVLVDFCSDGHVCMSDEAKSLQIKICKNNDMIPCRFTLFIDDMIPVENGWNLRHTQTDEIIIPTQIADDSLRRVSEWELLNWGIEIVMSDLKEKGYKILSFTDAPDIMPQLWFENNIGDRFWVQVVVNKPMNIADFSNTIISGYKGYLAGVLIYPTEGNVLYRSRPAEIDYTGLQAIN